MGGHWPERWIAAIAAASLVGVLVAATPAMADPSNDVAYESEFLRSLQLEDGAIVSDARRTEIEPYVANYAALGLARAARHTGDRGYLDAAVDWLSWYQAHMGSDGVVHDYVVTDGGPEPTEDEDSVDATSGTFLLALREAYLAAPVELRSQLLERFQGAIRGAVGAIEALRDSDGLTWAKPSWRVKYLMDNAEAYGGLRAAEELATAWGDLGLAATARDGARRAKAGVDGLWNAEAQAYDWAEHANGVRQPANWAMLYPDAVEQAWVVAYGLAESARADEMMTRLAAEHPDWDRPTAMDTYWDGQPYAHPVAFWPMVGWAFAAVGDAARASAGADHIRDGAAAIGRNLPLTAGSQGQLVVLMTGGYEPPSTLPGSVTLGNQAPIQVGLAGLGAP